MVASSAEARAWLEANTANIAIVDFMLKDGPATELAGELNRRAIPFVIYSGYPPRQGMSSELQGVPWLEKPTSRDDLLKVVLNTLMAASGQASAAPTLH
jgi:DNA-binding NtrC family response regulator